MKVRRSKAPHTFKTPNLQNKINTMKLLPKKREAVANGFSLAITNHYCPTTFGVRTKYESAMGTGEYIECGTAGTGFFVRSTESRSYNKFCKLEKKKLEPKYINMLLGREFDFDEEIAKVERALHSCGNDDRKRMLLENYLNILPLAKDAERYERIIDTIEEVSFKHHKRTSAQSHVLSIYKNRLAKLKDQVETMYTPLERFCTAERYEQFKEVVEKFVELSGSRRTLCEVVHQDGMDVHTIQVFFDLAIFDFMHLPCKTPMMRDGEGTKYYLYPEFLVKAKGSVDFEVIPLKSLNFMYREVPYDMIEDLILNSYADDMNTNYNTETHRSEVDYERFGNGLLVSADSAMEHEEADDKKRRERVIGELYIPQLKLRYYVRDTKALRHFVEAIETYIR